MRVACVICTDLFVSSGDISVTECGHLFHSHCIIQWLERSKTCPQCRCKTQEKKIIKIFIDCCESISEGFDSNELQNEVGNLRFKLSLKAVEAKKSHEEKEKLKEQTDGLREEVKKLEKQSRNRNDTVTALKMQLEYLSEMARDNKKLQEERDRMRIKLRLLTNVDAALTQSTEEVTEMLTAYSSEDAHAIKHLVTYCVVLKKELSRTMEERRKYSDERHRLRANGQRLERRLQQLETQQMADDTERAALEEDNSRLTKQVKALEASVVSPSGDARNSALTRLLSENTTPVELRSRPVLTAPDTIDLATPEVAHARRVDGAADGLVETPRLALRTVTLATRSPPRMKQASVASVASARPSVSSRLLGRPTTGPARSAVDCTRLKGKNLLMQNMHMANFAALAGGANTILPSRKRPADHGWDGFGGSSKPDTFPCPQPKVKVKLKNGGQVMTIDNFFAS